MEEARPSFPRPVWFDLPIAPGPAESSPDLAAWRGTSNTVSRALIEVFSNTTAFAQGAPARNVYGKFAAGPVAGLPARAAGARASATTSVDPDERGGDA